MSQCRTRASALRRQGSDSAQRQPLSGGTTLSNAAAASTWRSLVPHSAELSRTIRRAMFFGCMSGLRGQTGAAVPAASGAAIDRRTPPDRSGAVVAGGGHDDRTDEAAASVLVGVVSGAVNSSVGTTTTAGMVRAASLATLSGSCVRPVLPRLMLMTCAPSLVGRVVVRVDGVRNRFGQHPRTAHPFGIEDPQRHDLCARCDCLYEMVLVPDADVLERVSGAVGSRALAGAEALFHAAG